MLQKISRNTANNIKLLVLDVDGVLTDGRIWLMPDGSEAKVFHALDGYGIKAMQADGVEVAVISGRKSPLVVQRMNALGVERIAQGFDDKLPVLLNWLTELDLTPENVAYIGDDVIDIPIIETVAIGCSVPNAHPQTLAAASWISQRHGGMGAVRELCDLLISLRHAKNG